MSKYQPTNHRRLNTELTEDQYQLLIQFIPWGLRKPVVRAMLRDLFENMIDRPKELGKAINNGTLRIVAVSSEEEYQALRMELKQGDIEDGTK